MLTMLASVPASFFISRAVRAKDSDPPTVVDSQSFAYYEALDEDQPHSDDRTDGTDIDMPCIAAADITAGKDKTYKFWHGHDGIDHMFTVTSAHFADVRAGKAVVVYTTMVEGHRHALTVTLGTACGGNDGEARVTLHHA
jgi:hypothetical protein